MNTIIGLEQHVQLKTNAKLFCECPTEGYLEAEPNTLVCPVCVSHPGSKPYGVNEEAVRNAVKISLALGCKVVTEKPILVQRKHYFYPDLPSNYQRTSKPIAKDGMLSGVRIREVHLEEDPGRYDLRTGKVDYNRSGIPLVEIITEPDIKSPEHARKFLDELQAIMNYLNVAREEAGSTRIDANVSIGGHNRVEVKNINSFKGVLTALTYEAMRQKNLIKNNIEIIQETRHFDEGQGTTIGLRLKETAADYRYFPDPDVPPITISEKKVKEIKKEIPELPAEKAKRFVRDYTVSETDAFVITQEKEFADGFEKIAHKIQPRLAARFMRGVLKKQLNYRGLKLSNSGLNEKKIIELLELVEKKRITPKVAEKLLVLMLDEQKPLKKLPLYEELVGIEKEGIVEEAVEKVLKEYEKAVKDFKKGEEKALHFLIGKVMHLTKGKAHPEIIHKHLKKRLKAG